MIDLRKEDVEFIKLAILEARESSLRNDFPVGAIITIDDILVGKANNANSTQEDWNHHAETGVISRYSRAIKKAKKEEKNISLYTTLEPCIMCLGTSIMNRVTRIVYACPDPNAGACMMNPKEIGEWYQRHWPKIIPINGEIREEAYQILESHMSNNKGWEDILKKFRDMHKTWN